MIELSWGYLKDIADADIRSSLTRQRLRQSNSSIPVGLSNLHRDKLIVLRRDVWPFQPYVVIICTADNCNTIIAYRNLSIPKLFETR